MALHNILLAILLSGMAIFGWLAATTLKRAQDGVGWSLGLYFALVVPGIGGAALQILAQDATTLSLAKATMFICRAGIPVTLIALVFDMMGRPFRPRTLLALSLLPALTLILAASNSSHGLLWTVPLANTAGELVIHPEWGLWYRFVHAPYSYLLLGIMMAIFFLRLSAVSAPQRRSMMLFLVISLGPMLTGLLHSFGVTFDRLWLPALSVSLTAPLFLWIVDDLRHHRFRPVSYRELIEQINDPVIGLDLAERVVSINQAASELLGRDRGDLLGQHLPATSPVTQALTQALETSTPLSHEGRRFEVRKSDVTADDGSRRGQTLTCRDVTAELAARDELSTSEQLMRTIVEHSSHGIVRLRQDEPQGGEVAAVYRCVFANGAAAQWADAEQASLAGQDMTEILSRVLTHWEGDREAQIQRLHQSVAANETFEMELSLGADHNSRWLKLVAEPVDTDVVLTLTDITAAMQRQLAAEQRASRDHLTGVLNRLGFLESARTVLSQENSAVLLFVDLNGFKKINDEMGHQSGDRLLQMVAERLVETCRSRDLVGRYGGDEFVVLACGLTEDSEKNLLDRMNYALTRGYDLGNTKVICTASIGLARFPDHGSELEALLARADSEMYQAKRKTSGPVVVPENSHALGDEVSNGGD
ncbi:MAG: diguanylate cyclase [Lysobacterales bacterium]